MIVNSKYSSLHFGDMDSWMTDFDASVCYVQKYAVGEYMRIQFTGNAVSYSAKYISETGNETNLIVETLYTDTETGNSIFEVYFSINTTGFYTLEISDGSKVISSCFKIVEDDELKNTIILSYSHRRNEYGTIFVNSDDTRRYFNFRVEGGMFPSGISQALDNNFFRDQRFTLHHTSAEAYEVSILTVGNTKGVPQWVGNRINHIFNASNVLFDGKETKRSEGSTVETIELGKYYPLLVFKLNIEQSDEELLTGESGVGSEEFLLLAHDGEPILTTNNENILLTA